MVGTFTVAGIFAIVVMESFPLLMQRHLCYCQASIITHVACCQAGIVTLVVIALLLLMHRCAIVAMEIVALLTMALSPTSMRMHLHHC
jgi:hypothetical protein